jgi:methyl-accepting chemotaxis protein
MGFLDNLKISTKILAVVALLALATAFLVVQGGLTMSAMDKDFSRLIGQIAPAQLEYARAARRLSEIGHAGYVTVAYEGTSQEAKAAAKLVDDAFQAGLNNFRRGPEMYPATKETAEKLVREFREVHRLTMIAVSLA